MVRKINVIFQLSKSDNELATIHEHETLDLESEPPTIQDSGLQTATETTLLVLESVESSLEKNLQELSLSELLEEKRNAMDEKKQLRESLKLFESSFHLETGRKLKKDDREPIRHVYESYKKTKSKLKLLSVLLKKHEDVLGN